MPAQNKNNKGMSVLLRLSPETTLLLSNASERSGRSNTKEALFRLEDHLKLFTDLASPGVRISANGSKDIK